MMVVGIPVPMIELMYKKKYCSIVTYPEDLTQKQRMMNGGVSEEETDPVLIKCKCVNYI